MSRVRAICRFAMLAAALCMLGRGSAIHADFANLLPRVGADAHAVMAIKMQEIVKTLLARPERWTGKLSSAAKSHALMLPECASEFLLAADFDRRRQRATG